MGRWDSFSKLLLRMRPQHYISWLMPGAELVALLNIELTAQPLLADALVKVLLEGQFGLMHMEVQTYGDPTMPRRMLEYNVLAEHQHELPTCSFLIQLRPGKVAETPYVRKFIDGGIVHQFHFRVIKLWEVTAQSLVDLGWDGLLPLLPLTRGGKKPEMVKVMIDRLAEGGDKDLLALAEVVGGLAFTTESEKVWFKRRFAMFEDVLKDSWVYQEWIEKGREEGLEKGRQEGREEGREEGIEQGLEKGRQAQREAIEEIVKLRFPALERLAAEQVSRMSDLNALRVLLVSIASAQDEEVARRLLMDAGKNS